MSAYVDSRTRYRGFSDQSLIPLSRGPFRPENRRGLVADVVAPWSSRAWISRTPGAAPGGPSLLLRARGLASPFALQLPRPVLAVRFRWEGACRVGGDPRRRAD